MRLPGGKRKADELDVSQQPPEEAPAKRSTITERSLLDLPAELRLIIYEHLFYGYLIKVDAVDCRDPFPIFEDEVDLKVTVPRFRKIQGILRSCRLVYQEALPILRRSTVLKITSSVVAVPDLPRSLQLHYLPVIQHLILPGIDSEFDCEELPKLKQITFGHRGHPLQMDEVIEDDLYSMIPYFTGGHDSRYINDWFDHMNNLDETDEDNPWMEGVERADQVMENWARIQELDPSIKVRCAARVDLMLDNGEDNGENEEGGMPIIYTIRFDYRTGEVYHRETNNPSIEKAPDDEAIAKYLEWELVDRWNGSSSGEESWDSGYDEEREREHHEHLIRCMNTVTDALTRLTEHGV